MKVTEIFEARKKEGKPVLSFEIFPPKKEEALKNIDATLERLCDLRPDFISVTFGAGGSAADNKTIETKVPCGAYRPPDLSSLREK